MQFSLDDGSIQINLDLDYDTQQQNELILQSLRSIGGRESSYLWGNFGKWDLVINYIPTSDAYQINAWWENSTQLIFVWDSSTYDCMITNDKQPFQSLNKPHNNNWYGNVTVEEI